NLFRRLHRKIVVVDSEVAYVGGINFGADHLIETGPTAKQDYAVRIRGPIVAEIEADALKLLAKGSQQKAFWRRLRWRRQRRQEQPGGVVAAWVTRDNDEHTNDIEQHYRIGIRAARHNITIANAYFFPGYSLLRDLRRSEE